jgi:SCY1-like protein 2
LYDWFVFGIAALQGLLSVDPRRRMGIRDLLQSSYFNDINIRSIAFLNSLMEKDDATKASFFKGFLTLLPNFTPRIIQQKVIPPLMMELKNLAMAPFVLPLLFDMTKHMTQKQFSAIVFPHVCMRAPQERFTD